MFNIWVLAAVYDVCMHVLMEQVKPHIEGQYLQGTLLTSRGDFSSLFNIEGNLFSPYNRYVVVNNDPDEETVTVLIYSTDEYPLVLVNEGDEYEEIYRALYH